MVLDPQREAKMLEAIYRLRYQVYVDEWGFEKPEDHCFGLETDVYDQHSVHVYACSAHTGNVIGTARLILNSNLPFPVEQFFEIQDFPSGTALKKVSEISRFSLFKKLKKTSI